MWHGFGNMGWGWFGVGMIPMIVFWVVVILALAALVKWLSGGERGSERGFSGQRPIDILKARYAKGELTREQFEQMKRELEA